MRVSIPKPATLEKVAGRLFEKQHYYETSCAFVMKSEVVMSVALLRV